jgi:phage tail-like protein
MAATPETAPIGAFGFRVSASVPGLSNKQEICLGAFSDVSGLEATMEPKAIKEGGRNYGVNQRAGPVTFATVVVKRGITNVRDAWAWWSLFTGADRQRNGKYAKSSRCDVHISLLDPSYRTVLTWTLANAMPVKFKSGDMNARSTEVAIEELHFVHEGLRLEGGVR